MFFSILISINPASCVPAEVVQDGFTKCIKNIKNNVLEILAAQHTVHGTALLTQTEAEIRIMKEGDRE